MDRDEAVRRMREAKLPVILDRAEVNDIADMLERIATMLTQASLTLQTIERSLCAARPESQN